MNKPIKPVESAIFNAYVSATPLFWNPLQFLHSCFSFNHLKLLQKLSKQIKAALFKFRSYSLSEL